MMRYSFLIVCMVTLLITTNTWSEDTVTGPYFGQTPPGKTPTLFAPGIISLSNISEIRVAFSPDGNECFFTRSSPNNTYPWHLYYTKCIDNVWTTPTLAPFNPDNGTFTGQPFFSADGNSLTFTSDADGPTHLWRVERTAQGWGTPQKLAAPINIDNWNSVYYSETLDGTVYFASNRSGGSGQLDIWRTYQEPGQLLQVENLGSVINTSDYDYDPYVDPSGHYLLFARAGSVYVTYSDGNGGWNKPVNMNTLIPGFNNGSADGPSISPDGKYIFWRRYYGGQPEIYWVENLIPSPDPNGSVTNLITGECFNTIQAAIVYVQTGDIIEIPPGVYPGSFVLDKDITIRSIDPNDPFFIGGTIILGDSSRPVVTLQDNSEICTLTGLTLRAGSIGIKGTETNATIRNCRIMDNVTHGVELFQSSGPTLKNCLITANGQTGIKMHPSVGRGKSPCSPVIENCIIVDNGDTALDGGEPVIIDSIIN